MLAVLGGCSRVELFPLAAQVLTELRSFGDLKFFFSKQDFVKLVFASLGFLRKAARNYAAPFAKALKSDSLALLTREGLLCDARLDRSRWTRR